MKRALWIVLALVAIGFLGWHFFGPPDPEKILARIEVPPADVLSAQEELATFRLPAGFHVELVAAEPLVVDPVAMDWDDRGRLYVVEMRGFMPDIDGTGEDLPTGRVVVLQDLDGDGEMDESRVFLDGLVLPRAVAVLPEGVLIGAPPDLFLCRDANEDLRCTQEERSRVADYGADAGNVEHSENALLPGLDGWLYNSKSARRFRLTDVGIEAAPTVFRGQWGIAQDDEGRLYYNHNSGFLYADLFPAEYTLRQPATAAALSKPGVNVELAGGERVYGVRVAPGLNRAYQPGTLRRDGRQDGPTAVSGLVIQRGHQFGEQWKGDAFIPESAGAAVAHFLVKEDPDGPGLRASHATYPDPDYGVREFLASTDERFRPVDAKVGPDGALWIIDMYRGVIQHAHYVSDYLRDYVEKHDLAPPGATGRIWRIVREKEPIQYTVPPLDRLEDQLAAVDHPNGWIRDRAQRRLIHERDPAALPALRRLGDFGPLGQRHALWILTGRGELDLETWRAALAADDPSMRRLALRLSERLAPEAATAVLNAALEVLDDPDPRTRLQALHTLGSLPVELRPVEVLLASAREEDELTRQAAVSGLCDVEEDALDLALGLSESSASAGDSGWIAALSSAAFMQAQASPDAAARMSSLLDRIVAHAADPEREEAALAIAEGIRAAQELPGAERIVLDEAHAAFELESSSALDEALLRIRRGFTWQGDPSPGGARPLETDEELRRAQGAELFATTCASCHGLDGRGSAGLAPSLAGSTWVRDADDWLVRIALQGIRGPIRVRDETWNSAMPGHAHDPRFDDAGLSGLLTYIRRAWGHGDEPVSPETVARIRAATSDRAEPWTSKELLALPVEHRLDRYVGTYRVPIIGIELSITRSGSRLEIGRSKGAQAPMTEIGDGVFTGEGVQLRFDPTDAGPAESARVQFGSDSVRVTRTDS